MFKSIIIATALLTACSMPTAGERLSEQKQPGHNDSYRLLDYTFRYMVDSISPDQDGLPIAQIEVSVRIEGYVYGASDLIYLPACPTWTEGQDITWNMYYK